VNTPAFEMTPVETVAAPNAWRTPVQPVVVFDFDGVLLHGDAFHLFLRQRYARAPWRALLVLACLPVLLMQLLVSRLAAGRLLSRIALLGVRERRFQLLTDAFAARLVRRSHRCCRDGLRALRRHQAGGERVLVVTGCEYRLARAIFRELGMADVEVLGTQWRDGWFGMRLTRHNVGARKVELLAQHGLSAWQVAYSDSLHDAPMLNVAAEPVLVNGTPARCKKLEKKLGRAVCRVAWH
jgi:phosphatidylglycerophosphatase C